MRDVSARQATLQARDCAKELRKVLVVAALAALLASCGSGDGARIAPMSAAEAMTPAAATTTGTRDADVRSAMKSAERAALRRANVAFQADRIVSPAGDNALEHALQARRINARSAGAAEILADIGPAATSRVQAMIRGGDHSEARRVIALLEEAAPGSLTAISLQRQLAQASPGSASTLAANQQR